MINSKFHSNTTPCLISSKVIKHINDQYHIGGVTQLKQQEWTFNFNTIYADYIQPNLFPLIVIILLAIYLSIKYVLKQDSIKTKKIQKLKQIHNQIKQQQKYKQNKPIEEPIYELQTIVSEPYDDDDGGNTLSQINEYNNDDMSEEMINEFKRKELSKLSFNELSRVIAGGGRL